MRSRSRRVCDVKSVYTITFNDAGVGSTRKLELPGSLLREAEVLALANAIAKRAALQGAVLVQYAYSDTRIVAEIIPT